MKNNRLWNRKEAKTFKNFSVPRGENLVIQVHFYKQYNIN